MRTTKLKPAIPTLPMVLCLSALAFAQAQQTRPKGEQTRCVIEAIGTETVQPDLIHLMMKMEYESGLAADAREQNNKKVQAVKERLTALGYKEDQLKFTGNRFSPAGGPAYLYGGGQRPTGFDVSNNVLISVEGPELADLPQFKAHVSTLLDELSKLGASPFTIPISRISMGASSVVAFTVKDPSSYEKQAYQQALEKARPIADDIARRMKVQITGIESVTSSASSRPTEPYPTPMDEIPYDYLSSSMEMEEVLVRLNLMVRYSFK